MNVAALLPATIGLPLLGAGLSLLAPGPRSRRAIAYAVLGSLVAIGAALVAATAGGDIVVARMGEWPARYGVVLAADPFGALMLAATAVVMITCTAFASVRGDDERRAFLPLVLILAAGVGGAVLTADLFNLFVWFEVMLGASYGLFAWGGTHARVRAGAVYVTVNLIGTTMLLASIGLAFAAFGTVNMARLGELAAGSPALPIIGVLLLTSLAVKSALVPMHGWLPSTYPSAGPAVAALLAGLLTKVGIFAIFRVYSVVFDLDPTYSWLLLGIALASMVIGVLGAVGRTSMREILTFHMVSQVGYILLALAIGGAAAIAAGIFYLLQYMAVKTSLFLSAGAVETFEGTGKLDRVGGLASAFPFLAGSFLVAAFSLAGIPPLSGFAGKFSLIQAAFDGRAWLAGAIAIAVSLFTLLSMLKIWHGVFWGVPTKHREGGRVLGTNATVAPAAFLAAFSILLGLGAPWLFALAEQAALIVADPALYIEAVLAR